MNRKEIIENRKYLDHIYPEIEMPYSIKTLDGHVGFHLWKDKTRKVLYEITRQIKEPEIRWSIEELVKYRDNLNSGRRIEHSLIERARIFATFQNADLAWRYLGCDNLRLLQIISKIKNPEVYETVRYASKHNLILPSIEQIASSETYAQSMKRFAETLLNVKFEMDQAYKHCNYDSKMELNKIMTIERIILLMRAIALSRELNINSYNIRKAFPYEHGRCNPGYYEGTDLGEHHEVYLNDLQHQKILGMVLENQFNYKQ